MNGKMLFRLGAFGLSLAAVLGAKCPSIPSVEERVVQLVKTESAILGPFEARGNDVADDGYVDLVAEYDIEGALDDAGVDLDDVISITVSTVEVRVSKPDTNNPDRAIAGGTVTVERVATIPRGGCDLGTSATLVSDWSGRVNDYQSFSADNVQIEQSGVDFLNCLLAEYLAAIQADQNPENMIVRYQVDGETTPADDANFDWEVKLTIDIVGEVQVDVIG